MTSGLGLKPNLKEPGVTPALSPPDRTGRAGVNEYSTMALAQKEKSVSKQE